MLDAEDKIDWSRIGDTITGGRIVICDFPKGAFGLYEPVTIYNKKSDRLPIPSRIVLVEKKIKFEEMVEKHKYEILEAILSASNKRLGEKLKAIDDAAKDGEFIDTAYLIHKAHQCLHWLKIIK